MDKRCRFGGCPQEQCALLDTVWLSNCEDCPYWVSSDVCPFDECELSDDPLIPCSECPYVLKEV